MAKKEAAETEAKTKTVKMTRTEEAAAGGPTEADVHPDEVENFKSGGWEVKGK